MTEDSQLPFDLPAVKRKKVTADFGGGLVLLRGAERRLGLAEALAGCIREWRDPALVVHTLPAMLRFRMFAVACGYEDADDCDALRTDPQSARTLDLVRNKDGVRRYSDYDPSEARAAHELQVPFNIALALGEIGLLKDPPGPTGRPAQGLERRCEAATGRPAEAPKVSDGGEQLYCSRLPRRQSHGATKVPR